MLRKTRIVLQILFFTLFILLFFFFNSLRHEGSTSLFGWFFRLNPFLALITSISSRSIILPVILLGVCMVVVTAYFGRVFCGMVCPLGSLIDFFDSIFRGKSKKKPTLRPPLGLQGLKYFIFFALVILAILGVTFPLFMDPLLLTTRFLAFIVKPFAIFSAANFGFPEEKLASLPIVMQGSYMGAVTTVIIFAIIFGSTLFDRRFWCQYVCPSGAFFGILSRFAVFTRKQKTSKCNKCKICETRYCPTRAIKGENSELVSSAECIRCGICSADKRNCSEFGFTMQVGKINTPLDISRRHLVGGVAGGFLLMPALVTKSPRKLPYVPGLIRPPGAVKEKLFLSRCITCGACIGVCPENALHPALFGKDGIMVWNTPKLVPRIGFCKEDCTRCSEVCPTGALLPLTLQKKKKTVIGVAFVDKQLCRPWSMTAPCLICYKSCPYKAIEMATFTDADDNEWEAPEVKKQKCIGCGICEYWCPVQQESAIKVIAFAETRERSQ